jgi:hypothetical protein
MARSMVLGAVLGGLVLFLWGMVSWMVLPWREAALHEFTDEEAVVQAIQANAPESGIYVYPGADAGAAAEEPPAAGETMQPKPSLFVAYRREGSGSMAAAMITHLFTLIVVAFLVTWLVLQTRGLSYWGRVAFVVVSALAAALVCREPEWTWWGFSTGYILSEIVDLVFGGFLAALVIAWATRPATAIA